MLPAFQTPSFLSALTQTVDAAPWGGATLSECDEAAAQIQDGDYESWHLAWVHLAERVRRRAISDLSHQRKALARDAFLRAAQYYQTSGRFLTHSEGEGDARSATTKAAGDACFGAAMRLSAPIGERRELVDDEGRVSGNTAYFYRVAGKEDTRSPGTLLVVGTGDTNALGLYWGCVLPARRCGWQCLAAVCPDDTAKTRNALAKNLVATAAQMASLVDASCLALLTVGNDPAAPGRSARPVAMGNAAHLNHVLHCSDGESGFAAELHSLASLNELHEFLRCWLNGSDPMQLWL